MKKHQSKMLESQHHGEEVGNLPTVQHKQWQKQRSRGSHSGRNWEIEKQQGNRNSETLGIIRNGA